MIEKPTPRQLENRPGLPQISRRIGRHAEFREAMLRGLRSRHRPGLLSYTGQTDEDWTRALIDAWAATCDTLSFYSERLSQEAYLRTATEIFSVEALAGMVDYQLAPPTAAEVYLAFEADPDAADETEGEQITEVAPGLGIKSIPLDDERPQHFETVEPLRVKPDWNAIPPLRVWPQKLTQSATGFFVRAAEARIGTGTRILLLDSAGAPLADPVKKRLMRRASAVSPVEDLDFVAFDPDTPVQALPTEASVASPPSDPQASLRHSSVTAMTSALGAYLWPRAKVLDGAGHVGLASGLLDLSLRSLPYLSAGATPHRLTEACRLFGHNAVTQRGDMAVTPVPGKLSEVSLEQGLTLPTGQIALYLDRAYDGLAAGMVAILRARSGGEMQECWAKIESAETLSVEGFGNSAEVTRLIVPKDWRTAEGALDISDLTVRSVALFTGAEALDLPELPLSDAVRGTSLTLAKPDLDLASGQMVFVSGERVDLPGVVQSERQKIDDVEISGTVTRLVLSPGLQQAYTRETVSINANVARATHGETVEETLGSGDARRVFQSFTLKQSPLTYLSADTPSGSAPQLEVFVNGVLWHPVRAFDETEPGARVYVITTLSDGKSRITFGNGEIGARLPTGENNITARYRKGAGLAGQLRAGQLSIIDSKPRALKSVTNPLPAQGGSDGEAMEDARRNAPMAMLTLDRIVSLRDFSDFARGFPGISKALANWSWLAGSKGAFVTVTGDTQTPLALDTGVVPNLVSAMSGVAPEGTQVVVGNARIVRFTLSARLRIDPDYTAAAEPGSEPVRDAVRAALRAHFAFENRRIGQPVRASEVITLMQSVPGVIAVDLDALHRLGDAVDPNSVLLAEVPRQGGQGMLQGAELLLLSDEPVTLGVF
ncbi:putative baseplate assembly protein [Pacificoceanicola onchidii]|uniref:putative baseplate assembly protein n=1 Tax=Pacificoceanicola onchidii TaxID=2562685 RepID=UPI001456061D|nr:putative baseplate assembly protein [Pacificoceanicola onchidii]